MNSSLSSKDRSNIAETLIAELFESHGWKIDRSQQFKFEGPDLVIRRRKQCFAVGIKAFSEGRADRVIPILSQAILQAQSYATDLKNALPLAVVVVDNASQSLSSQCESFVEKYAPNTAFGLVSKSGLRYFKGVGLEELKVEPAELRWHGRLSSQQPINIFSDLNQWMLKVILAPDIPDHLLRAPRQKYRSGAELAEAANVSPMSASRFLQQLRNEGYLDESSRYVELVRRHELFRRWRSVAMRPSPELSMRFFVRGSIKKQIHTLLGNNQQESCLALFEAAEALGVGHVSGVPPYIYVSKLPRPDDAKWRALEVSSFSEVADIIVRQAPSPKSVFRGAVQQGDLLVSDIIQVWLDVVNHPSRGEEQANLIYEKALRPIIGK